MRQFDHQVRRLGECLLAAVALVLTLLHSSSAQRAMPDPALLPSTNPLCNGILVPCLVMDDFAGHAYLQPQVLPATERRDTAAVLPFGLALGLAGRVSAGLSTHFTFWKEGEDSHRQLGPLRLSLTVRLLPIFPLWAGSGDPEDSATSRTDYAPPRGFRLGLSYEHEIRVGQLEGRNSLGLLTELAALRLVASWLLGPVQLAGSIGALYDWGGQFATGELAAQVGLYLPFFKQLKVYVEALGRGVPTAVMWLLSVQLWTYFLAFGGLTGLLLRTVAQVVEPVAGLAALGVGLTTALGARALLRRAAEPGDPGTTQLDRLVGTSARVLIPAPAGATGKIRLEVRGQTLDLLARSSDGTALGEGIEVIVLDVRPWLRD